MSFWAISKWCTNRICVRNDTVIVVTLQVYILIINQQLNMYAVRCWKNNKTPNFYAKLYFSRNSLIACDCGESPLVNGGCHSELRAHLFDRYIKHFFTCGLIGKWQHRCAIKLWCFIESIVIASSHFIDTSLMRTNHKDMVIHLVLMTFDISVHNYLIHKVPTCDWSFIIATLSNL